MATKKKELLEQENSAPETTVPVENTPPPDEAQADMAAPSDGGDLNELLASMDPPDEEATTIGDDGSLPELTESEVFCEMDTEATAADAPSRDGAGRRRAICAANGASRIRCGIRGRRSLMRAGDARCRRCGGKRRPGRG